MNEEVTLNISFRDQTLDIPAEVSERVVSPHSGRALRVAESKLSVSAESVWELTEALAASLATDREGNTWLAQVRSESYTDAGPHEIVVEWTESENLKAELVTFEGLALTPSSYEERVDEDGIVAIEFQATLSLEDTERLRALQRGLAEDETRYWPVVRVGISEQPRQMRLGRVLWNNRDDSNIEHKITLVDEAQDADLGKLTLFLSMGGEPQLSQTMGGVAGLAGQFDALLELLEKGQPIDTDAVRQIRDAGTEARRTRGYTFYEVDDVSNW